MLPHFLKYVLPLRPCAQKAPEDSYYPLISILHRTLLNYNISYDSSLVVLSSLKLLSYDRQE